MTSHRQIIQAPERGCFTGAFLCEGISSKEDIKRFKAKAGKAPKIIMWFHAFVLGFDFPAQACSVANEANAYPFIRLEPWSWQGKDDNSFSLKDIIKGRYDKGLSQFAQGAKMWGHPLFLAFSHEMNGNWYPWSENPEEYKAAYKRVFKIFKNAGAENITWVWNPNVEPLDRAMDYYPGDKYVDWIGIDGFNWGSTQDFSSWLSFDQIFGRACSLFQSSSNKPLMISEFASAEKGGNKAAWIKDTYNSIMRMERLKAVVWFDLKKEADWRIDSSHASQATFAAAISNKYFIGA
jgi:beta-mannanase